MFMKTCKNKEYLKNYQESRNNFFFLLNIKITEKTMHFGDIDSNKREFHKFKPPIHQDLVSIGKIMFIQVNYVDKSFKCYIGDKDGDVITPLCIMIPQMSGYIKCFYGGSTNVTLKTLYTFQNSLLIGDVLCL